MSLLSTSHVFISYSRRDTEAMQRIVSFLRGQGIKVWVDNERLVPGTPIWEEEIEKAIKGAVAIAVLLSPDAKNSEWVRREVTMADQFRKRVFPVLVAGDEEESIPLRLITRQFVDVRKNEEAGLHSLKTAISFYLEELAAQEEKERVEAEKLARAEEERKAAERKAERLRLENEAAEKAAREAIEKAAREKAEKEAIEREAARLDAERKTAEKAERIAIEKANKEKTEREAAEEAKRIALQTVEKEKAEREVAEREATQLKAERSAAQKNIFSRMGYAWASWSTGKKILVTSTVLIVGIIFACGSFFTYSIIQGVKELNRPQAPVQFVLPGNNPTPIATEFRTKTVYDLAFSPDGAKLISMADQVQIWNAKDGSLLRSVNDYGFAIAVSPDGKTLASTSASNIRLWSLNDDTTPSTLLSGHTDTIWDLAFSPDGKRLASGSDDATIRIWDVGTGLTNLTLKGHNKKINSIAFSPDGKFLASSSEDETVKIWDTSSGELIHTITDLSYSGALAFSPDGKYLVTTIYREVQIRDLKTYNVVLTISQSNPECIAFSPDGKTIAIGYLNDSVSIWNVADGKKIKSLVGHTSSIRSIAFSPTGTQLASGSSDGIIRLWNITQ